MDKLSAPNEEQRLLLAAWRTKALDRMPYLASLLFSLRAVNAPGSGTFSVDAHHRLYIDFDAVEDWGADACSESLLHEAMHVVYEHATEAEDMNVTADERPVWNVCADSAINDDLRDAGCTFIATNGVLPEVLGCPDYLTASMYLADLRLRMPPPPPDGGSGDDDDSGDGDQQEAGNQGGEQQPESCQDQQEGSGNSQTTPQQGDGGGDSGEPGQGQGGGQGQSQQGQGGQPNYQGCGSGAGASPAPWELPANDDLNGAAPPATGGEKEVVKTRVAHDIQEAEKSRGDVPAGMSSWAEQALAKPQVPWQRVLAPMVRRFVAIRSGDFDTTYTRRNRRRPYTEMFGGRVVNPGIYAPVPSIALVRDTSGSMSDDDLNRVGTEVAGIARQIGVRGRELMVIDVDAEAYPPKPYTRLETLREVQGRGGTDMRVGIEAAAALKPSVIIVCTDGFTPWDEHATTRIPVVACLIGSEYGGGQVPDEVVENVPSWMHTVAVPAETVDRAAVHGT